MRKSSSLSRSYFDKNKNRDDSFGGVPITFSLQYNILLFLFMFTLSLYEPSTKIPLISVTFLNPKCITVYFDASKSVQCCRQLWMTKVFATVVFCILHYVNGRLFLVMMWIIKQKKKKDFNKNLQQSGTCNTSIKRKQSNRLWQCFLQSCDHWFKCSYLKHARVKH